MAFAVRHLSDWSIEMAIQEIAEIRPGQTNHFSDHEKTRKKGLAAVAFCSCLRNRERHYDNDILQVWAIIDIYMFFWRV